MKRGRREGVISDTQNPPQYKGKRRSSLCAWDELLGILESVDVPWVCSRKEGVELVGHWIMMVLKGM